MKNYDDFSKAVQILNDERKSRLAAASRQGSEFPGEYRPQGAAQQAESTILATCRNLLDTAGHPFTNAQLTEWVVMHRSKSYPSHDPILAVADFVHWQAAEIGQETEARESMGSTSGTTRGNSPRS